MKYSREQVSQFKNIPIVNYLHSVGIDPVGMSGVQYVYYSPLSKENTPSFYVNPTMNRFNCFCTTHNGDLIELVSLYEKLSFVAILARLETIFNQPQTIFSFSGQSILEPKFQIGGSSTLKLLNERPLSNENLIRYINSRGIPVDIAQRHLFEVSYQNQNRDYYAIGFKTDQGSFAIRSKAFKGWLGTSAIRTIQVVDSPSVDVFEGFFDFLSALAYNRLIDPTSKTVVLNSTSNLVQALPVLKVAKTVNCYFDNDNAGRAAFAKLQSLHLPVKDCSGIYENFNDFNDFLLNKGPV